MKKTVKFLYLVCLLAFQMAFAQTAANVTVTVQVLPPYSTYFPDYLNNPSTVYFTLLSNGNTTIKLKVSLTGDNGVSIVSSNSSSVSSLQLFANQIKILNGTDLKNYLNINSAVVSGINKNDLFNGTGLPEGTYTLCIQAIDFTTGEPMSEAEPLGCSNPFEILQISPPELISPPCNEVVEAQSVQNLIFTWLPPPNVPANAQYKLKIVEIIPVTKNPNDAMNSATLPAFFETMTNTLSFFYGPSQPLLKLGHKYAWRVSINGRTIGGIAAPTGNFQNNGNSEVCSFVYGAEVTAKINTANVIPVNVAIANQNSKLKIKLVSPPDGSEIQWVTSTPQQQGHHEFVWENPTSEPHSYHTKVVKIKEGQTKEDAIKNNPDLNLADKSEPMIAPLNWNWKFENGKYAWQVSINSVNLKDNAMSDVWMFTTPSKTETDFNKFTMCGYIVNVTTWINKDIDNLSGTGYLYLWKGSPKIDINFEGLTARHCGIVNGKKTDWRVTNGYIGGLLSKYFQPIAMKPKDIEGDFYLTFNSFSIISSLNAFYDTSKGYYKIEEGDKGEGCKRKIFSQLEWRAPFTEFITDPNSHSFEGHDDVIVDLPPQDLTLYDPSENTKGSNLVNINQVQDGGATPEYPIGVFGSINFDKDLVIHPDLPTNTILTIEKGSYFNINGKQVTASLSGKFSIADGTVFYYLGKVTPNYLTYTFQQSNSLLLKLTADNDITEFWNKKGSIFTNFKGYDAYAVLGDKTAPGDLNVKGLVYPDIPISLTILDQNTNIISFKNAFNKGEGFYLDSDGTLDDQIKFNAFKSTVSNAHIKIEKGKLLDLDIEGNMEIPFINAKAPFSIYTDYNTQPQGYINIAYDQTTVYDNGIDKITCIPISATFDYDKIYLNGSFNFTNSQGKSVIAQDVFMKDIMISANGDAKTKDLQGAALNIQTSGTFNQFPYKLKLAAIDGTGIDKHYQFFFWGDITLEEKTLTPKSDFKAILGFYQPKLPREKQNIFSQDNSLTASIDGNNISIPSKYETDTYTYNNVVTVDAGDVCAAVSPNALGSFDGCFKYFSETDLPYGPTYGSGFMVEMNSTIKNPMVKTLQTKIMVGKKDNYRYWFMEAEQQGFLEVPTGILDIVVTGFGGRVYYHMNHPNLDGNINNDDYQPSYNTGFGMYANTLIKTAGSDGKVLWGNLSTEIQTNSNYGLSTMTQRGDVYLLSSGVNQTDAKITAVANFTTHFTTPRYLAGDITVNGNVFDLLELYGTASVKFSDDDWHIYAGQPGNPINVNIIPIGKTLGGYFTIKLAKNNVTLGAGVSGELYGIHIHQCKCLVSSYVAGCICKGCYTVDVSLGGSLDATATFPSLQLGGNFSITGSAGVGASICGIGLDPSISATFSGAFSMPHPFCLAGGISLETPWPFPNIGFDARWKDGTFSKSSNCN